MTNRSFRAKEHCACNIWVAPHDPQRTRQDHNGHRWHKKCYRDHLANTLVNVLTATNQLHII